VDEFLIHCCLLLNWYCLTVWLLIRIKELCLLGLSIGYKSEILVWFYIFIFIIGLSGGKLYIIKGTLHIISPFDTC
jgi:hypothetical protein